MTSSTGCRSDSRPTTPRRPSRTLPWRRSSAVVVGRSGSAPAADRRPAVSGKRRTTSSAAGPARRASSASSTAWKRGRSARMIAPYGSSNPGRNARPRITAKGSSRPATRRPSSATKRETPTPPRPSRRTVVATPSDAASSAGASRTNAASRPTNRALLIVAGMSGILGVPTTDSGRKTRSGAGAGREERGQHVVVDIAVEAGRRGVAGDLAEGHLVEPGLAAGRAEDRPGADRSFGQLELVGRRRLFVTALLAEDGEGERRRDRGRRADEHREHRDRRRLPDAEGLQRAREGAPAGPAGHETMTAVRGLAGSSGAIRPGHGGAARRPGAREAVDIGSQGVAGAAG